MSMGVGQQRVHLRLSVLEGLGPVVVGARVSPREHGMCHRILVVATTPQHPR